MRKNWLSNFLVPVALVAAVTMSASAAEPTVKVVVEGLDNPSGIAVQPGTGHVFVASHAGVHRVDPATGKLNAEITGYPEPTDIYGKGPKYPVGPLGLAFLDKETLVVGDGSRADGVELVRIYKVGATAAAKPQKEDAAAQTLGPIGPCEESPKGEGNFYGVATNGKSIYITCNGDDTKGWVAHSAVTDGKAGPLKLSIATKVATGVDAPGPAVFSPAGKLVVGQIGEVNVAGDSLLTIYGADGKLETKIACGLSDICGLAYHPKTGKLYATDFSWIDATKGGLFVIDTNAPKGKDTTTKLVGLDKPAGCAFDTEGNLFIAVFGVADGKPTGKIVKVSGL